MAKTPVNSALGKVHGKLDGWVYRVLEGDTVIARPPTIDPNLEPTEEQEAVRERFRRASLFAKGVFADPARKAAYRDLALRRGFPASRLFAFIVQDYAVPPRVTGIDLQGYQRTPGGVIRVFAADNGEVMSVTVTLKAADGTVLEAGAAVARDAGWDYAATTVVAAGTPLTIEASATDRAGNVTTRTEVVS